MRVLLVSVLSCNQEREFRMSLAPSLKGCLIDKENNLSTLLIATELVTKVRKCCRGCGLERIRQDTTEYRCPSHIHWTDRGMSGNPFGY